MLELKQLPVLSDNKLIWVMWIYLDSQVIKLSTKQLTLSSNVYSCDAISYNSISSISKRYTIDSQHLGELAQLSFKINKINDLPSPFNARKFTNYFYPQSSTFIINRVIDFGFVYQGADNENQITWLNRFRIDSLNYVDNGIELNCIEFYEFDNLKLRYATTQNSNADSKADYVFAGDLINQVIPITYGTFRGLRQICSNLYDLAPVILTDYDTVTYRVGNARMGLDSSSDIYIYDGSSESYVRLYSSAETFNILDSFSNISLMPSSVEVWGECFMPLSVAGGDISPDALRNEVHKLSNYDETDYITLKNAEWLRLTTKGQLNYNIFREAYFDSAVYAKWRIVFQVKIGGTGTRLAFYCLEEKEATGFTTFADVPAVDGTLTVLISELTNSTIPVFPLGSADEYYIGNENLGPNYADCELYFAYLHFTKLRLFRTTATKTVRMGTPRL